MLIPKGIYSTHEGNLMNEIQTKMMLGFVLILSENPLNFKRVRNEVFSSELTKCFSVKAVVLMPVHNFLKHQLWSI